MFKLKRLFVPVLISVCGCTVAQLTPEGEKVHVVNTISATDLVYYDKAGAVKCLYLADERNCINEMKNKAALIQASVILITSREGNQPCGLLGTNSTCVNMTADAYKRKSGTNP